MTTTRQSDLMRGVTPLLLFAALTAALDVYAGNQLQELSPLSVAAISFALTAVFFLGGEMARRGVSSSLLPLVKHPHDVIAINISTMVTWLSMLYALKYLEPAVVNVVALAMGPVLTVMLGSFLRRGSSVLGAEIAASLGICGFIGVLGWGAIAGRSGLGNVGPGASALGILLTLVCGLGSTVNVIYSKRLSDAGYSPQAVLSIRFFFIIAVTWAMVAVSESSGLSAAFLPAVMIAVIGVALPLYLIQVGIKYSEPITASLISCLSPPFAFLLQLPDRRLHVSFSTLVGILGITVLVAVGVLVRARKERGGTS